MYKKGIYTVTANEPLTPSVWRMTLEGDTQYLTRPGQFVNIEVEGLYLRRPISVCDYDERTLTLIYKVVGEGTARLSEMKAGVKLDLLTGLGNGCGPLPMLRALSDATGDIPGELSFEERMGCGFGGCMGCSCQTKNGAKRICKEGPVLKKEEIIW